LTDSSHEAGGLTDPAVHVAAARAIELIADGARVGLGSGRAVTVFIAKLAERQRDGVRVTCVCASRSSAHEARRAGLSVAELGDVGALDVTVDGADEVSPNLDLLKGGGGAMVRERIVAAAAKSRIIIVGREKLVRALGERGGIPLEVIPMAEVLVTRKVEALGLAARLRLDATGLRPFVTDNGNVVIDCALPAPLRTATAARRLERALLEIAGVVDTGLFLGVADRVIVGHPDGHADTLLSPRSAGCATTISVVP
jgi:ribose 5-phosphate isomerase A